MPSGKEIRAQIDTENVKALLLINGGGAIAMLTLFPITLGKYGNNTVTTEYIIWSIFLYAAGILFGAVHNHLRRLCSLAHDRNDAPCAKGKFTYFKTPEPCICFWSWGCMWASLVVFIIAGVLVLLGSLAMLDGLQST